MQEERVVAGVQSDDGGRTMEESWVPDGDGEDGGGGSGGGDDDDDDDGGGYVDTKSGHELEGVGVGEDGCNCRSCRRAAARDIRVDDDGTGANGRDTHALLKSERVTDSNGTRGSSG